MYLNTIKQKQKLQNKQTNRLNLYQGVSSHSYLSGIICMIAKKINKNKYKSIELILNAHTILILVGANVGHGDII